MSPPGSQNAPEARARMKSAGNEVVRGDRTHTWFVARVTAVIAVAILATALFMSVATTDAATHADGRLPALPEAFYRALTLFVLGASAVPAADAGAAGIVLWVLYFGAPVLSASFLVDGLRRMRHLVRTPERVARGSKGHVIICGYGRHGRLALEQLMTAKPETTSAVVIDRAPAQAPFIKANKHDKVATPVLREDLTHNIKETLARAGVRRATSLVAATGNDVLNVAICQAAYEQRASIPMKLLALVSDSLLADRVRGKLEGVGILNTYDESARGLLAREIKEDNRVGLVILGFGKFGQALARMARAHHGSAFAKLAVVDRFAERKRRSFERDHSGTLDITYIEGDAEDPEVLDRALTGFGELTKWVAVCTDNDVANLHLGFVLMRRNDNVRLLARTFDTPPESVSELFGKPKVECFALHELLAERIAKALDTSVAPAAPAARPITTR